MQITFNCKIMLEISNKEFDYADDKSSKKQKNSNVHTTSIRFELS